MSIPEYSLLFWITASIAVIMIGIAKAGFGGGVGVVATPLVAITLPVAEAAALLLPLLIMADMFALYFYSRTYDRPSVKLLLSGALVGIALGAFFFSNFSDNEQVMRTGMGLVALLFVLFQLTRRIIFGVLETYRPPAPAGVAIGVVSGFVSTLAHVGGPPAAIYLLPQKFPKHIFVGTNVIIFTTVNWVKLIPYGYLGLLHVGNLTTIALLAPLCLVGVRLGLFLNKRVNEYWFNMIVYIFLLLTGIQLILGRSLVGTFFG